MGTRWNNDIPQHEAPRLGAAKALGFIFGGACIMGGIALLGSTPSISDGDPSPYMHCHADTDGFTTCEPSDPRACEEDEIYVHLNRLDQPSYTDQRAYCLHADDVMPDLIGWMD